VFTYSMTAATNGTMLTVQKNSGLFVKNNEL